tara:strand:- start:42253 stop:44577 length:2325 start_codon:yes stop_codon:yes gene_type:complete
MDIKAYKPQIKELIPLRKSPDFNDLLNKILFGEKNSDKFIIKMEINRLATPCARILDIRDKVTEPCIQFQQEALIHYLTKETIKVLQENINLYGLYTVGAFEAVHEFITNKKNIQNIQQNKIKPKVIKEEQCELLPLSQKNKRGAPRMFFVSDTKITLENGKTFKAQTSNLSISGLKLKLSNEVRINNDIKLLITFTGLGQEYTNNVLKKPVAYRLLGQEDAGENSNYFYLSYIDNKDTFINFIGDFIKINQHKYKIDVHYYYQIAKTIALKNSYLAQMNTLPIYLDINTDNSFLFTLKNQVNQALLDEWHCDEINQLPDLFKQSRLMKLIKGKNITTIYTCYNTIKGKKYFLSASEEELNEQALKQTFINYGRNKNTLRVYHLSIAPYQYKSLNNLDITEVVPDIFKRVTHSATLQSINVSLPFSDNTVTDKQKVNQLIPFIHRSENQNDAIPSFTLMSEEQRKEERYLYQSKLSVTVNEHSYDGAIVDFSYSGLKIKLDQLISIPVLSIIKINLTELQKISQKFSLSDLKYKVVRVGANNVLHLQVCSTKTLDICTNFFSILVKNNAKHFTCHPLKEKKQPVAKHLIEIAEESFVNSVFFISKVAARHKIMFSAIDLPLHPLHKLFSLNSDNNQELNYYPIANNHLYERLVTLPFKESENTSLQKEAFIYIRASKDNKKQWEINSFLDEDFDSESAKIKFVKESYLADSFYALHYRLTSLAKINLDTNQNETRAISRFAIHLTKKLEEELAAVEAIIEVTDRTEHIINTVMN